MNTKLLIIKALGVNPEKTIFDIRRRIDRSYSSTRTALSELLEQGVVTTGYTLASSQILAYVLVHKPKSGMSTQDIKKVLDEHPDVVSNYNLVTSETYSYFVHIKIHVSTQKFGSFIDTIRSIAIDTDSFGAVGVE